MATLYSKYCNWLDSGNRVLLYDKIGFSQKFFCKILMFCRKNRVYISICCKYLCTILAVLEKLSGIKVYCFSKNVPHVYEYQNVKNVIYSNSNLLFWLHIFFKLRITAILSKMHPNKNYFKRNVYSLEKFIRKDRCTQLH